MKDINVYSACDKAIKAMNRENLEAFTKLKGTRFEGLSVIRTVLNVYTAAKRTAAKRYYEVAFEAYLLGLAMCDVEPKKAQKMAENAITDEWIEQILTEPDFMTLYRFDTETERKAYRLAEALEVAQNREKEIDKALKLWSQQLGQYAINVTDYAILDAFLDAGVKKVMWVSEKDQRVCGDCYSMDKKVYSIDEIPLKPHPGCRCRIVPVKE